MILHKIDGAVLIQWQLEVTAPGHFWATMVFPASRRHHWHVGFPPGSDI